ncbi:MAG: OmpA family protein [Ferruginibacter sp.]
MRKLLLIFLVCMVNFPKAQILKGLGNKVKQKVETKTENKILDKVDKKTDDILSGNINNDKEGNTSSVNNSGDKSSQGSPSIKSYSKYDFVPGEKIIVFEDFAQDAIGDFPDKWNTNSSGEVVTLDKLPGHWFMLTKKGIFMPEFIDSFPQNFTMEFDLTCDNLVGSWGLHTNFVELANKNKMEEWQSANNRLTFHFLPGGDGNGSTEMDRRKNGDGEAATNLATRQFADNSRPVHIAFWRQKERMRVYLNEEKVWDVPKAILPEAKLNSLIFWVQLTDDKSHFLMSNLRVATGAPDIRKKILEQNKWVTHGILFDVNSDNIKPESYGTLKEMANVLKENPDLKVKIIGHTDADGKDDANLDLSKRRSAAVKVALAKEFGIDESRMQTDGKGENEPIDKNDSPAGKANNRRVEFIKI